MKTKSALEELNLRAYKLAMLLIQKRLSVSDFRHSAHLFLDEIDKAKGGVEQ